MDQARFAEAQRAFEAGDYRAAAEGFLASAEGPGGPGNGEAYHLAGNALMKLRKYQHAATVYQHALRDPSYPKVTSLLVNLGTAQVALGEYADAVSTFGAALGDPAYPKRYKVLQGRAGALYAMGRYDEAARDYIAAAEPGNPDRGRAFNNLGLALAAAGRPAEAVEAYKAAIATDGYGGKGKAAANLGLAYAALGRPADALAAFDAATGSYGHALSGPALEAQQAAARWAAQTAVPSAQAAGPQAQAAAPNAPVAPPKRETVEGWRTGEIPTVVGPAAAHGDLVAGAAAAPAEVSAAAEAAPGVQVPVESEPVDSEFFTRTDDEMKDLDRAMRRQERADRRASSNPWARAAAVALVVIVVVGASAGVFFAGYGYPSQQDTVSGLLDAYRHGRPVAEYWVAAPANDIGKEMATIPPTFDKATIDSVERSAFSSKVIVTIRLEKGAPLRYSVSLSREGVGWKVVGIDNDWGPAGS